MPINLRVLQLVPAATHIIIPQSYPKAHFTPYLQNLLYIALTPVFLTFIATIITYSPIFQVRHLQFLLSVISLLLLSNILLVCLLSILLLPLRENDLVEGRRGEILRIGMWILCWGIGTGYLLIVLIILVAVNDTSPNKQGTAILGISGTLFTSLFGGIIVLALKRRGPRSHDDKTVQLPDENPQGKGNVPPTPGTKEAVEANVKEKQKKEKKVGNLGFWLTWTIGSVFVVQVLGEVGQLSVAGVALGQINLERQKDGAIGNGRLAVEMTGCFNICGDVGEPSSSSVVGSITASPMIEESTTTILQVVTRTTTTTLTITI